MRLSLLLKGALVAWVLGLTPTPCPGAEEMPAALPQELTDLDIGAIEQFVNEMFPPGFAAPTREEWDIFWQELAGLLSDESLENLASYKPAVELALAYLAEMPEFDNDADWLKQRLDFVDVADAVIRELPVALPDLDFFDMADSGIQGLPVAPPESVAQGNPVQTPQPPPPGEVKLPPLVVPTIPKAEDAGSVSASLQQQRHERIRSDDVWTKTLAKRPLPANAVKLIPILKAAFKAEGVPPELVWIAEAESSLNPNAKSPSGAVGLFQFMPATAERFGLLTAVSDDRKNPEKSARAAARYLKVLYRQMGSWRLALASYNAGEGRVKRTQEKKNAKSFDEIADQLPVETQMYVPKVVALITLRENVNADTLPAPAAE